MGLLDGGLASAFANAFSGFYLDGVLTRTVQLRQAGGDIREAPPQIIPCKLQIDRVTETQRANPGFTDAEVRIFVLAAPLGTDITSDDVLTAGTGIYAGVRWKLSAPIGMDPAGVAYDCAGVRA